MGPSPVQKKNIAISSSHTRKYSATVKFMTTSEGVNMPAFTCPHVCGLFKSTSLEGSSLIPEILSLLWDILPSEQNTCSFSVFKAILCS